jgi:hypothetical protein
MGGSTKRTMSNKDKNKLFDIAIKKLVRVKKTKTYELFLIKI